MKLTTQLETAVAPVAPLDVDAVWQRAERSRQRRTVASRVAVACGALIVGLAAFTFLGERTSETPSPVTTSVTERSHNAPGNLADARQAELQEPHVGPAPVTAVSGDHWHNSFGISVCGEWAPPLTSSRDDHGIHSHQDGVIHIHPWSNQSAYENATLGLFFDTMEITVTDADITLDSGELMSAESGCSGTPATMRLVRWQNPQTEPSNHTTIDADFGAQQFTADGVGYALVIGPADAPVEPPPSTALLSDLAVDVEPSSTPTVDVDAAISDFRAMLEWDGTLDNAPQSETFFGLSQVGVVVPAAVDLNLNDLGEIEVAPLPQTDGREQEFTAIIERTLDRRYLVAVHLVNDEALRTDADLLSYDTWYATRTDRSLLLALYPDGSRSLYTGNDSADSQALFEDLERGPLTGEALISAALDLLDAQT